MVAQSGSWADTHEVDPRVLRESRSGLSGFGGRPVLHPAWRTPEREDRVVDLLASRIRRQQARPRSIAA